MKNSNKKIEDLGLGYLEYFGFVFKTGVPVSFPYTRNNDSSLNYNPGRRLYQQDIEPAGRFLLFDELPKAPVIPGWEKGSVAFENPLVLIFNLSGSDFFYDENSWKNRLSKFFKNKKGEKLSIEIAKAGYDAIVTVRGGDLSEIVDLTMWK